MHSHNKNKMSKAPSRKLSVRFPVYQIDFSAVACGKNVASSKRRIRWRFGFSNKEALDSGETGTACRGEERELCINHMIIANNT